MISFKQEVMKKLNYLVDEDDVNFNTRDRFMKNFFLETMDQIGIHIHMEKQRKGSFRFYSIGAFFRMAFRKYLPGALKKIPYELIHNAKIKEYTLTGQVPELALWKKTPSAGLFELTNFNILKYGLKKTSFLPSSVTVFNRFSEKEYFFISMVFRIYTCVFVDI
jgi:hypothetical protein